MPRPKTINGVTVNNSNLHEAFLTDTTAVERKSQSIRDDLDYRASIDHPNPAYRAEPGDLDSAQRSYANYGYDPQGYPQGWTGPRTVDTTWKPRTWAERQDAPTPRSSRRRERPTRRTR